MQKKIYLKCKIKKKKRDIPRHKTLTRSPVTYVTAKHTALYHNQDILYNTRPSYSLGGGPLVNRTKQNKYMYDPLIITECEHWGIWPQFVGVQTGRNEIGTTITNTQYSPVCLDQAKLQGRLLS